MEGDLVDPLELNKYPKIIKEAQIELGNLDILVCGQCHMVFHFVEQFQDHRLMGNCSGNSSIRENNINETKAQVWAFLLWKGAQNLQETENSWVIYQRWCKMESHVKEAWVVAGRNVQVFTKLSAAKMQEVRAKTGRPKKILEDDPLEEGEIKFSEDPLADSDEHSEGESELDTEEEAEKEMKKMKSSNNGTGGKSDEGEEKEDIQNVVKKIQMNPGVSISTAPKKPQPGLSVSTEKTSRLAKRTDKVNNTEKECTVEKILAKRFNPRRKLHEYLIKWEGCPHEQNTWEPPSHLDTCKYLVEAFERNLARQKEAKAAAQAALVKQQQKALIVKQQPGPSGVSSTTPGGRSQRASKQRAMDQVKQWCGNISDRDDDGGHKRKAETDSDDDMDEKKIKMELDSGSEDEWQADESEIDRHTSIGRPKILQKTTSVLNGIAKKQQMTANEVARSIGLASPDRPSSPPVFLANSKGVVKVYKNQMPNLATGVYIMSKKDGIVKLESSSNLLTNSNATNIVRVQKSNATAQNIIRAATKSGQSMSQIGHTLGQSLSHNIGQTANSQVRMVQKSSIADNNVRLSPGMSRTALMSKLSPGRLNNKPPLRAPGVKERLQAQRMQIGTPQLKVMRTVSKAPATEPIAIVQAPVQAAPITMAPKQLPSPEPEPDFKSESSDDEFDPFPKNLPPVEPDSPPREFTLDPLTGLIVGQAEGEPEMKEEEEEKTVKEEESQDMPSLALPEADEGEQEEEGETTTITLPEGGEPLMITGEDGVVYQVAGQNAEGQTLLVAQGADGQQQCVYVTTTTEDSQNEDGTVLTLDSAVSEALGAEDASAAAQSEEVSEMEPLTVQTDMGEDCGDDDSSSQVVAQLVKAELPSPGGTRKVVLLLPDGNLLMTEVDAEQYASLELDK